MTAGEASPFFRRQAFDWIAANPAAELRLLARKMWYTLSSTSFSRSTTASRSTHATSPVRVVSHRRSRLLLALGLVGLTVARPPGAGTGSCPCSTSAPVVSFVCSSWRPGTACLFRSRWLSRPEAPSWAIDRVRGRAWGRPLARGAMLIAVGGICRRRVADGPDNGRTEEQVRMGLHEIDRGRVTEGERWISNALNTYRRHPFPGVVHLRAGQAHETARRAADPKPRCVDRYEAQGHSDRRTSRADRPAERGARVLNGLSRPTTR